MLCYKLWHPVKHIPETYSFYPTRQPRKFFAYRPPQKPRGELCLNQTSRVATDRPPQKPRGELDICGGRPPCAPPLRKFVVFPTPFFSKSKILPRYACRKNRASSGADEKRTPHPPIKFMIIGVTYRPPQKPRGELCLNQTSRVATDRPPQKPRGELDICGGRPPCAPPLRKFVVFPTPFFSKSKILPRYACRKNRASSGADEKRTPHPPYYFCRDPAGENF